MYDDSSCDQNKQKHNHRYKNYNYNNIISIRYLINETTFTRSLINTSSSIYKQHPKQHPKSKFSTATSCQILHLYQSFICMNPRNLFFVTVFVLSLRPLKPTSSSSLKSTWFPHANPPHVTKMNAKIIFHEKIHSRDFFVSSIFSFHTRLYAAKMKLLLAIIWYALKHMSSVSTNNYCVSLQKYKYS